jgi:hypothetical protein
MGALNPAAAFDHPARKHPRFAEHLQGEARADDIDNGINRAHFMKVHLLGWLPVDFPFGDSDALENCDCFFFDPAGERTAQEDLLYFGKRAAMGVLVRMFVVVFVWIVVSMRVFVFMLVRVMMFVLMMPFVPMLVRMLMFLTMLMLVIRFEVHIKFRSFDPAAGLPRDMQVEFVQAQFIQLPAQVIEGHSEIEERAEEHIAADAAKDIQVKGFHPSSPAARALI